jgi:MoxR-like ATPase
VSAAPMTVEDEARVVQQIRDGRIRIGEELSKVIVGQNDVIEQLLICLFAGGHCLITGAPGLAKTLLVSSVAKIFHLNFQRIQFTPDLMPADITGTEILGTGRRRSTIAAIRSRPDFCQRRFG